MGKHFMKDDIEGHALGMGYRYVAAVNVKYRGRWPTEQDRERIEEIARIEGVSEDTVGEWIWENVSERFWEDAQELAREAGYSKCYSEGRSGGWLYVEPHIELEDGTIPDFGDRSRWLSFQRKIKAMLEGVSEDLSYETEFRLECATDDQRALIAQV